MFGFKRQRTAETSAPRGGLFSRLRQGLSKTGRGLTGGLPEMADSPRVSPEDMLEELENRLLMADVGVDATRQIIDALQVASVHHRWRKAEDFMQALRAQLFQLLAPCEQPLEIESKPFVILVVGVNGSGKTTTIGKLARHLQEDGRSVMLAAGDTYRAAAVEQLQTWGERNAVPVIAQDQGADSASVIHDAVQAVQTRGVDVLIADTAGRLHTQSNLMEELKKVKRVMGKLDTHAPHEILLVLDAGTGQNALVQAREFHQALGLTGIAVTKLDGTAKGGIVFALAQQMQLPFRFIGVGEKLEDLRVFEAEAFVDALLAPEKEE